MNKEYSFKNLFDDQGKVRQGEFQRRSELYWKLWNQIKQEKREISDVAHVTTKGRKSIAIQLVNNEWWNENCLKHIYPEYGPGVWQRIKDMPTDELLRGRHFKVAIKWTPRALDPQTEHIWVELLEEYRDANGERYFMGALRNSSVIAYQAKWGSAIGPIYARNIEAIERDEHYTDRA